MISKEELDADFCHHRIIRMRCVPVTPGEPARGSLHLRQLTLRLDDDVDIRIWPSTEQNIGCLKLLKYDRGNAPAPAQDEPSELELTREPAWIGLGDSPIAKVLHSGCYVEQTPPRAPPEPTGDDAYDSWIFGGEDWDVWLNTPHDRPPTYVLQELTLTLAYGGQLVLQPVDRAGASSIEQKIILATFQSA